MGTKAWYQANKKEIRAKQKAYRQDNKVKARMSEQNKEWKKNHPERVKELSSRWDKSRTGRNYKLTTKYGITLEEYEELLVSQNGRCAICGTDDPGIRNSTGTFAVDHDHYTGRPRGLLCMNCNIGIGNLQDNVGILQKAIQYLRLYDDAK